MPHNLFNDKDKASVASDEESTGSDIYHENALKITNEVKTRDNPRNLLMRPNVKKRVDRFDQPTDKTRCKNSFVSRKIPSKSRILIKKQYNNRAESKKIINCAQIKKKSSMLSIRSSNNMMALKNSRKTGKKIPKRNCSSLIDLKIAENYNPLLLSSVPKESNIPIMSLRRNFEYSVEPNYPKKPINYLKNFNFASNSRLCNQWETSRWPFFRDKKGTLSLVTKSSSTTSLPLGNKTYNCGILTVKESEQNTAEETAKGGEKVKLNTEAEKSHSDVLSSSTNSDSSDSSEGRISEEKKPFFASASENEKWDASSQTKIEETSYHLAFLDINEPIRIKYIDEATEQMKELLLYSDEFFKDHIKKLREKGDASSKLDTLESILKQSRCYNGKPVRVLLDAETFVRKLKSDRKHPENIKTSNLKANEKIPVSYGTKDFRKSISLSNSKLSGEIPVTQVSKSYRKTYSSDDSWKTPTLRNSKLLKESPSLHNSSNAFKHVERSSIIDSCSKNVENVLKPRPLTRWRNPFSNPQKKLESSDIQSNARDVYSSSRTVTPEHFNRQSKDIFSKYGTGNEFRSIIALKRINVEEIVTSNFRHYFHFFSKLGGRLKSGTVISKQNSHVWMKRTGMVYDEYTQKIADNCFAAIARMKLVLNIHDYIQYLMALSRKRGVLVHDVLQQLMSIDIQSLPEIKNEMSTIHSADELERAKSDESHLRKRSNSVSRFSPRKTF